VYAIAPGGIFWSIQGEAHLSGVQMAFVRLAGCSIGCAMCDTDYSVRERLSLHEVVERVAAITPDGLRERWVWITGGEPTDHDYEPLARALKQAGYFVAMATAGTKPVTFPFDWLSVSPHDPSTWVQKYGHELKIVPHLGNVAFDLSPFDDGDFMFRYLQPVEVGGQMMNLAECVAVLKINPRWALSIQIHKQAGVP
jgi:7-carboxy-7-deazaguanine synthase